MRRCPEADSRTSRTDGWRRPYGSTAHMGPGSSPGTLSANSLNCCGGQAARRQNEGPGRRTQPAFGQQRPTCGARSRFSWWIFQALHPQATIASSSRADAPSACGIDAAYGIKRSGYLCRRRGCRSASGEDRRIPRRSSPQPARATSSISSLSPRANQTSRRPRLVDVCANLLHAPSALPCERYHQPVHSCLVPLRVASSGRSSAELYRGSVAMVHLSPESPAAQPLAHSWLAEHAQLPGPSRSTESLGDSGPYKPGEQESRPSVQDEATTTAMTAETTKTRTARRLKPLWYQWGKMPLRDGASSRRGPAGQSTKMIPKSGPRKRRGHPGIVDRHRAVVDVPGVTRRGDGRDHAPRLKSMCFGAAFAKS